MPSLVYGHIDHDYGKIKGEKNLEACILRQRDSHSVAHCSSLILLEFGLVELGQSVWGTVMEMFICCQTRSHFWKGSFMERPKRCVNSHICDESY